MSVCNSSQHQIITIIFAGQRPRRESLCDEEDGRSGHAGHRPADIKCVATQIRAASRTEARVLYVASDTYQRINCPTGEKIKVFFYSDSCITYCCLCFSFKYNRDSNMFLKNASINLSIFQVDLAMITGVPKR